MLNTLPDLGAIVSVIASVGLILGVIKLFMEIFEKASRYVHELFKEKPKYIIIPTAEEISAYGAKSTKENFLNKKNIYRKTKRDIEFISRIKMISILFVIAYACISYKLIYLAAI